MGQMATPKNVKFPPEIFEETIVYLTRDELGDGTVLPCVSVWEERPERRAIPDPLGVGYGWACPGVDKLRFHLTTVPEDEARRVYPDIPEDSRAIVMVWTSGGVRLLMRGDN